MYDKKRYFIEAFEENQEQLKMKYYFHRGDVFFELQIFQEVKTGVILKIIFWEDPQLVPSHKILT